MRYLARSRGYSQVMGLSVTELVSERGGESVELWGKTINPQFARVLKTIGFDRTWTRAEGAYLWDEKGERFTDWLGGFGMFNVGRNNPRVRAALVEALELDLPGSVQLGASPLPPLLAEALLARTPARLERVLFTSTGTEAVEAALKLGRAATGRQRVVSLDHGFHGLTLGSLSANGNPEFTARFGPLLPGFTQVRLGDLEALEVELRGEDVAVFLAEPVQGKGVHIPPDGYFAGGAGALPPLRHALLRRRGADRLRADGEAVRVRALGPRARSRPGREVALGRVHPGRGAADVEGGARGGLRLDGERVQPRLDVRAERARDGRRARDARARSTSRASSSGRPRLGQELLDLTEPLVEKHDVVREVRGLGLLWAIEFSEPSSRGRSYRIVERLQHGLFAQLVVVPLFRDHRILIQVAGHGIPVIKGLPPLVVTSEDVGRVRRVARRGDREGGEAAARDGRVRADRRGHPLSDRGVAPASRRRAARGRGRGRGDRARGPAPALTAGAGVRRDHDGSVGAGGHARAGGRGRSTPDSDVARLPRRRRPARSCSRARAGSTASASRSSRRARARWCACRC